MEEFFFKDEKDLWGFRLPLIGAEHVYLNQFPSDHVKKIVDTALQVGWQLDFLPHLHTPCIFIRTPESIYHYFLSKEDAHTFRDDIMGIDITDDYPSRFMGSAAFRIHH